MSTNAFFEEVQSFIKIIEPTTIWKTINYNASVIIVNAEKEILILEHAENNIENTAKFSHVITKALWNKNKEASKSRLCSLIGVTRRIHGRKCLIKKINKDTARLFVDENHVMGYANSQYNYGLYLNETLVATACFSKGRPMNRLPKNKKSFELIRFCNKNNTTVVGGLSKLLRYFENEKEPGDVMTYVDRSWGKPNAYYALGFILDNSITSIEKLNYKLIKNIS